MGNHPPCLHAVAPPRATPAYVRYHKNHFLDENEEFALDFFLPVGFF